MTARVAEDGPWPQGAGEMAARIRRHDWVGTPLGPIEQWSASLRTTVDLMLDCVFPASLHWGPQCVQLYNDAYVPVIGTRHPIALGGNTLETFSELREALEPLMARVRAGETVRQEAQLFRYVRNGAPENTWFTMSHQPVREAGQVIGVLSIGVEVTERVQDAERLNLVVHELNHRVKNNLAIIQAMARQSFRGAPDPAEAADDFMDRLVALARANDVLTGERAASVDLGGLASQALAAHVGRGARLELAGPPVELTGPVALALTMALHELATNAVKYGAWSDGQGEVRLQWDLRREGEAPRLGLTWREKGGPPVKTPARRGFGSRLIERALSAQMEGQARLVFEADGLVCEIDAPLPDQGVAG